MCNYFVSIFTVKLKSIEISSINVIDFFLKKKDENFNTWTHRQKESVVY